MKIASFDIGIKNLAMCVLQQAEGVAEPRILEWRLDSFQGETMAATVEGLHALLRRQEDALTDCRQVLVERQAGLNKRMVCISHAVQMYHLAQGRRVTFCDPRNKLKGFTLPDTMPPLPTDKYARTKALGLLHVRAFLADHDLSGAWSVFLSSHPKQDDLADAVAQEYQWTPPWHPTIGDVTSCLARHGWQALRLSDICSASPTTKTRGIYYHFDHPFTTIEWRHPLEDAKAPVPFLWFIEFCRHHALDYEPERRRAEAAMKEARERQSREIAEADARVEKLTADVARTEADLQKLDAKKLQQLNTVNMCLIRLQDEMKDNEPLKITLEDVEAAEGAAQLLIERAIRPASDTTECSDSE